MDLLFHTPTQFAVLALVLVAGWFFGLASHPGGRKWKERYRTLEAEHKAYREERERTLNERDKRITDLEAERDRLSHNRNTAPATDTAAGATAAEATHHRESNSGWFGWGRDNLSRIRGIDEATETRLHDDGIKRYKQIEDFSAGEEAALEDKLGMARGTIESEQWREQAVMLREGREDDHARDFA